MPFAQLNFEQKVGNSTLTIRQAGCFGTMFCDGLETVGVHVDPPTINDFFTKKNIYLYDQHDHANDDLYWGAVTKYCPQFVVSHIKQQGDPVWPNSNMAGVEFYYKDHYGVMQTHFAWVKDAANHVIIDAWDGKEKTEAEFKNYYGEPIAWATYQYHTPQTTPAGIHNAPASAPAAHTATPQPMPQAPKKLYLPPSVAIWHIYNAQGPYTLPYALKGTLSPKMFGGLTYDILGNPAPHIYLIQTKNFGRVAIYAGPDTVAQFPGVGHGEGENTSIPVNEVVPAPDLAEPAIVYARFDVPMKLVTNKDTHSINFVSGNVASDMAAGTLFEAVGKATLPNCDIYFMDDNCFGIADERQRTPITVGLKTIDLSPAPAVSATNNGPVISSATMSHVSDNSDTIQIKPINPTASWQQTFEPIIKGDPKASPRAIMYAAKDNMSVYDFATGNDEKPVEKNLPIPVVGTFIFNGRRYYLAESSFKNHTWYGFPVASLKRQKANDTPFQTNDDINQLDGEIRAASKAEAVTKRSNKFFGIFKR